MCWIISSIENFGNVNLREDYEIVLQINSVFQILETTMKDMLKKRYWKIALFKSRKMWEILNATCLEPV